MAESSVSAVVAAEPSLATETRLQAANQEAPAAAAAEDDVISVEALQNMAEFEELDDQVAQHSDEEAADVPPDELAEDEDGEEDDDDEVTPLSASLAMTPTTGTQSPVLAPSGPLTSGSTTSTSAAGISKDLKLPPLPRPLTAPFILNARRMGKLDPIWNSLPDSLPAFVYKHICAQLLESNVHFLAVADIAQRMDSSRKILNSLHSTSSLPFIKWVLNQSAGVFSLTVDAQHVAFSTTDWSYEALCLFFVDLQSSSSRSAPLESLFYLVQENPFILEKSITVFSVAEKFPQVLTIENNILSLLPNAVLLPPPPPQPISLGTKEPAGKLNAATTTAGAGDSTPRVTKAIANKIGAGFGFAFSAELREYVYFVFGDVTDRNAHVHVGDMLQMKVVPQKHPTCKLKALEVIKLPSTSNAPNEPVEVQLLRNIIEANKGSVPAGEIEALVKFVTPLRHAIKVAGSLIEFVKLHPSVFQITPDFQLVLTHPTNDAASSNSLENSWAPSFDEKTYQIFLDVLKGLIVNARGALRLGVAYAQFGAKHQVKELIAQSKLPVKKIIEDLIAHYPNLLKVDSAGMITVVPYKSTAAPSSHVSNKHPSPPKRTDPSSGYEKRSYSTPPKLDESLRLEAIQLLVNAGPTGMLKQELFRHLEAKAGFKLHQIVGSEVASVSDFITQHLADVAVQIESNQLTYFYAKQFVRENGSASSVHANDLVAAKLPVSHVYEMKLVVDEHDASFVESHVYSATVIAVGCEIGFTPDHSGRHRICLVELYVPATGSSGACCYLYDFLDATSNAKVLVMSLVKLFEDNKVLKVTCGLHHNIDALSFQFGVRLRNTFDIPTAYALAQSFINPINADARTLNSWRGDSTLQNPELPLNALLEIYGMDHSALHKPVNWDQRPLTRLVVDTACAKVSQLLILREKVIGALTTTAIRLATNVSGQKALSALPFERTYLAWNLTMIETAFKGDQTCRGLDAFETLNTLPIKRPFMMRFDTNGRLSYVDVTPTASGGKGNKQAQIAPTPSVTVRNDVYHLPDALHDDEFTKFLNIMPQPLHASLVTVRSKLVEIVMDIFDHATFLFADNTNHTIVLQNTSLVEEAIVKLQDIFEQYGGGHSLFAMQDFAIIPETLHRVSVVRNASNEITNLSYHIRRAVPKLASCLVDVVHGLVRTPSRTAPESVLVLGGDRQIRADVVRCICEALQSLKQRVTLIDGLEFISGSTLTACSVATTRLPVENYSDLTKSIELIAHHPLNDVLVVDEITTEHDAMTITQTALGRAVVASVSCTSLSLMMQYPHLSGMLGGIRMGGQGTERISKPAFTVAIEVLDYHNYRVHPNIARSVDAILQRREVPVQSRWSPSKEGVPAYITFENLAAIP